MTKPVKKNESMDRLESMLGEIREMDCQECKKRTTHAFVRFHTHERGHFSEDIWLYCWRCTYCQNTIAVTHEPT